MPLHYYLQWIFALNILSACLLSRKDLAFFLLLQFDITMVCLVPSLGAFIYVSFYPIEKLFEKRMSMYMAVP